MIAVGARFVVKLISCADKVMFAGNQYTALLHDVGGKAARISCRQYRIQTRVIQYRRTRFAFALHSGRLTSQQTQLSVCLTPWNTKETELLDTVQ